MNKLEQYWKQGVAAAALYAAGLGVGMAEPVQYVETQDNAAITQTVQNARATQLYAPAQLSKAHLDKIISNIKGQEAHKNHITDAMHDLAETPTGASILAKVPTHQSYRVLEGAENNFFEMLGMGGGYDFGTKEIKYPTWVLNQMPASTVLSVLHESEHLLQDLMGMTAFQETNSPYVYSFGEQLMEADAVTAELAFLQENPDKMPKEEFANGRNNYAPVFNQMWQQNFDKCQDKATATQMTRKQFIQKMILNQNPQMGMSDESSIQEKCDYQISQWKGQYQGQTSRNFDKLLHMKFKSGQPIKMDLESDKALVEKVGALVGLSKKESMQLFEAVCQNDSNLNLDMATIAVGKNPDSIETYKAEIERLSEQHTQACETSDYFEACRKMKQQAMAAYQTKNEPKPIEKEKGKLLQSLEKGAEKGADLMKDEVQQIKVAPQIMAEVAAQQNR